MSLHLSNQVGESVEVPISVARNLFKIVANVDSFASTARKLPRSNYAPDLGPEVQAVSVKPINEKEEEDDKNPNNDNVPLHFSNLDYSKEVLEAVAQYAVLPHNRRTAIIPKPLNVPLSRIVQENELDFVKVAEKSGFLIQLLDVASCLGFEELMQLCAAYISERVHEIALAGPDIMTAAERTREFLRIHNEWTPEEIEHLHREMEYARQVDPSVY
ncbi:unnamed protein product [Phytomonas sp. Hart1]|nr:unnamed protein product [Phytomonas sp. Hart1]|eukprot:CCW66711.1 unnamed protein product [Phytomonas sp. isolate Hart1]